MNTENSKAHYPYKFVFNLPLRLDLKSSKKHITLQNLTVYYTWKNINKDYKKTLNSK